MIQGVEETTNESSKETDTEKTQNRNEEKDGSVSTKNILQGKKQLKELKNSPMMMKFWKETNSLAEGTLWYLCKVKILKERNQRNGRKLSISDPKTAGQSDNHSTTCTQEDLKYQKLILQLEDENCFDHEKHISRDSSPAAKGDKTVRVDQEMERSLDQLEKQKSELQNFCQQMMPKKKKPFFYFFKRHQRTEVEMKPGDTQVKEEGPEEKKKKKKKQNPGGLMQWIYRFKTN